MAYLLSNTCTENYWNWTTIVEIIVGGWVVSFFETHCISYTGKVQIVIIFTFDHTEVCSTYSFRKFFRYLHMHKQAHKHVYSA